MSTSEWTISTLKEYFESKFEAQQKALERADESLREYKSQANEYRGALKDQSEQFARRLEVDKELSQVREQLTILQKAQNVGEGITSAAIASRQNTRWLIALVVTIALASIGFFFSLNK